MSAAAFGDGSFLRPDTAEGWSELAGFLAGMPLPQVLCGSPSGAFPEQ
jgi:hypothetical protein